MNATIGQSNRPGMTRTGLIRTIQPVSIHNRTGLLSRVLCEPPALGCGGRRYNRWLPAGALRRGRNAKLCLGIFRRARRNVLRKAKDRASFFRTAVAIAIGSPVALIVVGAEFHGAAGGRSGPEARANALADDIAVQLRSGFRTEAG